MKVNTRLETFILLLFVLASFCASTDDLSPTEKQITSEISINKAFAHIKNLAGLSPRLVGSGIGKDNTIGTDYDAALYIKGQLESYGLKTWIEEFTFTTWVLYEYKFIIDYDGNFSTLHDQVDMTGEMIPPRHWPDHGGSDIRIDAIAPIAFLNSEYVGDVSGKVIFAPSDVESKNDFRLFEVIWDNGAVFNITCRRGFSGIKEIRWWKTFSIRESDFALIKSKANVSTKVRIVYKTTKRAVKAYNVVGMIDGEDKREVILVAHYDSVFNAGANDNASGTSALLEVARVLSNYKFRRPIFFLFTDGEEEGLYGAYEYLRHHRNKIEDSIVFNVDCVGYGEVKDLYVGINYNVRGKYYSASKEADSVVANVTKILTGHLPVPDFCDDECMDSFPFKKTGIATTNLISENIPYLHSSLDTPVNINRDLLFIATRIIAVSTYRLAEGGGLAEPQTPPPTTQAPQQQTQSPTQTQVEKQPQTSPPTTQSPQKETGLPIVIFLITFTLLFRKS